MRTGAVSKDKLVAIALPKPFKSSGQIIPNCSLKQLEKGN